MTARYKFEPGQSWFTVQGFATGLLSFAGHSPVFAVRDFRGGVGFDPDGMKDVSLELTVAAESLQLVGDFSATDRREIETRMWRDVLQVADHPDISYQAEGVSVTPIAPGRSRLRVGGHLSLHGVTRIHPVDAELQVLDDALRVVGEGSLRLSDYRISPVTALGGTIRLKDELRLAFDIIGLRVMP